MAKSSGKRGNAFNLSFYGSSELLKKIDRAGGNVEEAIGKAVVKGAQLPKLYMMEFMNEHRYSGLTASTMTEDTIEWKDGKCRYRVGYDIKKGGMASLFLDVGTPKMKPHFFVHHAVEKNLTKISELQESALKDALQELL